MSVSLEYTDKVCVRGKEETGSGAQLRTEAKKQAILHTCGTGEVDSYELVDGVLSTENGGLCMNFHAHIVCRSIENPVHEKRPVSQKGR